MKIISAITGVFLTSVVFASAGPYSPAADLPGSDAIPASDPRIVAWANAVGELMRGPVEISDPESPLASFGSESSSLGRADAFDSATGLPSTEPGSVVSLGDGGMITLRFPQPITDGLGFDFVVFENGFSDTFLELAFVEVTSDGRNWARFPSQSLTQNGVQIDQANPQFSAIDPTDIDGLAGKYRAGWGTPFDLSALSDATMLDLNRITEVRIVDVVGSIDPSFGHRDSANRLINDAYPTPFASGGFDLDAVGVLHQIPEPSISLMFLAALITFGLSRRREDLRWR
ncbi:MAG: PEP-CTERM sorting domain-containing protein [Chthoniobacteraceae bacterium]